MINEFIEVSNRAWEIVNHAHEKISDLQFKNIEDIASHNQFKVLKSFKDNRVSDVHFIGTTGYGYDDQGREVLDSLYSQIFNSEDALVRHNIISGTHALSLCMFGVLRPGDTLLSVTGKPYDTLEETIGIRGNNNGSLKDFGINYNQVNLKNDTYDLDSIKKAIDNSTKAILIQRSKGYGFRKTMSIKDIETLIVEVKNIKEDVIVIVDNCYGEFVEKLEPTDVGADLVAGSLIKNPGGSLANTGGYIVGKKEYIELCSYKLNAVGIGKECGATLNQNRLMFQGIYFAPFIVSQAIKTAVLTSEVFSSLNFKVNPTPLENRSCIIQAIEFGDKEAVIAFCQGIQKGSPIDSFVTPMPWDMPGYDAEVIMAAGAFNQGSSIELSADAPIKPPYVAYMQGGVTYDYGKAGILYAVDNLINKNII